MTWLTLGTLTDSEPDPFALPLAEVVAEPPAPIEAADEPREMNLPVVPTETDERNMLISQAWAELDEKQKVFIREAEARNFNITATVREMSPYGPSRMLVSRWKHQPAFALIWKLRLHAHTVEALAKDGIVASAAHIRDQALKPKPILFQGSPTGFEEHNLGEALRANEQLARLGGHMKNEETVIVNQGPGLVIQVMQKDGQVIDVTPRGVVIDLPHPA